jgi:hypothetical protein
MRGRDEPGLERHEKYIVKCENVVRIEKKYLIHPRNSSTTWGH